MSEKKKWMAKAKGKLPRTKMAATSFPDWYLFIGPNICMYCAIEMGDVCGKDAVNEHRPAKGKEGARDGVDTSAKSVFLSLSLSFYLLIPRTLSSYCITFCHFTPGHLFTLTFLRFSSPLMFLRGRGKRKKRRRRRRRAVVAFLPSLSLSLRRRRKRAKGEGTERRAKPKARKVPKPAGAFVWLGFWPKEH